MGRVYAGGVGMIPGETPYDRHLTVTVLEADHLHRLMAAVFRMVRARHAAPVRAHRYRLQEVDLESDPPQEVNLDGELLGSTPVCFRVLPQALCVVVGEEPDPRPPHPFAPWWVAGIAAVMAVAAYLWKRRRASRIALPGEDSPP